MELLIKSQFAAKKNIEKAYSNFKKSPKERLALVNYSMIRLTNLEDMWKTFVDTHKLITQGATGEVLSHQYFEADMYNDTEELYIIYKLELKENIARLTPSTSSKTETVSHTGSRLENQVKLPKISIPVFSGKYTEWTTFKDLYVSLIHTNSSLDDVQKMHYLKSHLSGEAEQLLRHIPITSANYNESWLMLNNRYDNKRYLANCLLKRFMSQPAITNESCTAFRQLLDTTMETLNGLKNLGINISNWDVIVVYIITSKLDTESRKQWETTLSKSEELPKLSELKEFLESKFRSLEFLDSKPRYVKPNFPVNKPKVLHVVSSDNNNAKEKLCMYCKQRDHKIFNCKQFGKIDCNVRRDFVRTNGLCFNCLGQNHSAEVCRSNTKCRICKHKHHSLLHPKPLDPIASTSGKSDLEGQVDIAVSTVKAALDNQSVSTSNVTAHFSKENNPTQVLLATALVEAPARNGQTHVLRALIDQGSQATFVTESTVQALGLKKTPTRSTISGVGGDQSALASKYITTMKIQSRQEPFSIQVRAHVLSTITSLLPTQKVAYCDWVQFTGLKLADPEYHTPNKIDILIGADVFGQIIRDGLVSGPKGTPVAQKTALGWVLSGPTQIQNDDSSKSQQCFHNVVTTQAINEDIDLLKKFWQIEDEPLQAKILTPEEQRCEEFYTETTTRDETGRYVVRLPFREEDPQCKYGNTKPIAVKRFHLLENKFKRNPEIKEKYSDVIHEYLKLGHMERINKVYDSKESESVYLPHHAVIREDKSTTKLRAVFDASCKGTNGVSLNDDLMIGPKIQQDLRHIVMRWRMHPICISADLVKMYRQIKVTSEDADFQRLVWRDDPESEIEEYKLVRVTFGTASAPYLAVKTLQQLAVDEGRNYPAVSEKVKTDYYVDDLMTGCQSVEEGKVIHAEMKELMAKGGFELQKWVTNSKELAQDLIKEEEGQKEKRMDTKVDEVVKILGLSWDKETDSFQYTVNLPAQQYPVTKRRVISDISRLFDPLGWAAPCVIVAKVMIQKLWLAGIDWDETLPTHLLKEWQAYRDQLVDLRDFRLPRWIKAKTNDVCTELHGFCDASKMAYAAVVYLRVINKEGTIQVNLVASKTKVAPTMQVSIPRLELMGAVLLAKLLTEVAEVLSVDKKCVFGWTDSTVVLSWLSSHPSRWTTFIGNRTSDILSRMDNTQWAYVQSAHNPADVASRGATPSELAKSNLWLHGPSLLYEKDVKFTKPRSLNTELEQRKITVHMVTQNEDPEDTLLSRFSSLQKLVRVIAFCRRFLKLKENKINNKKFEPYLTKTELRESINVCIKKCQQGMLKDERQKLKSLRLFTDEDGILRVGGRIEHADIPSEVKHPVILPSKSNFTKLVIDEAHKKTLHGGVTLMLNYIRSKYWILSAKQLIRAHVHRCVSCIRHTAATKNQLMGQLPACRVTPARPFLHCGVDFAGPISVRTSKGRGNKSYKGYICLFVCMATKAIHLEVASDLTSDGFLAAFKRLVARRGHVSDIWSDNGTNFVGAASELRKLVAAEKESVAVEIREWLNNNGVTWHFIPSHAPNFGGLWEAGVKSTKFHLKRVIGDSTLTFEELTTLLSQIEACLNSRPLTVLPDNQADPSPLTPAHFLVGEPLVLVAERNYEPNNITSLRRWQLIQRMNQNFWRRWSQEYLLNCQRRCKWTELTPEPNLGDVVLVKEENLPPARWLMGRVIAKHPGSDNITRVVTLKCNKSIIKRPTSKLCILPVAE